MKTYETYVNQINLAALDSTHTKKAKRKSDESEVKAKKNNWKSTTIKADT